MKEKDAFNIFCGTIQKSFDSYKKYYMVYYTRLYLLLYPRRRLRQFSRKKVSSACKNEKADDWVARILIFFFQKFNLMFIFYLFIDVINNWNLDY